MATRHLTKKPSPTLPKSLCASVIAFCLFTLSNPLFAEGGSVHHSGQASKHSALALSEGAKTSTKVVSGVAAVPLLIVGGVSTATGTSMTRAGESVASGSLSMQSNADFHEPLNITELVITADPAPNKVTITSQTRELETKTTIETH